MVVIGGAEQVLDDHEAIGGSLAENQVGAVPADRRLCLLVDQVHSQGFPEEIGVLRQPRCEVSRFSRPDLPDIHRRECPDTVHSSLTPRRIEHVADIHSEFPESR